MLHLPFVVLHWLLPLCVQVYKVDLKRDLIYVIGAVPGTKGAYVRVRDCQKLFRRKREKGMPLPPFPTSPSTVGDILGKYVLVLFMNTCA
jgi:hypothetical protein